MVSTPTRFTSPITGKQRPHIRPFGSTPAANSEKSWRGAGDEGHWVWAPGKRKIFHYIS